MSIKRWGYIALWSVTSLSLAVTLTILLSPFIYHLLIEPFQLEKISGLNAEDLKMNYEAMWRYLIHPTINQMVLPHFSSSSAGLQHFIEVKQLMQWNGILTVVGVLLSGVALRHQLRNFQLKSGIVIAMWLPVALLFAIVVAFDQIFILFHQIFFRNDLWRFNPLTDPIITVLPQEFFLILFVVVIVIYEICLLITKLLLKIK